MTQTNRSSYNALEYGVMGLMTTIPTNYTHSFIVFYSSEGVNRAMHDYGIRPCNECSIEQVNIASMISP